MVITEETMGYSENTKLFGDAGILCRAVRKSVRVLLALTLVAGFALPSVAGKKNDRALKPKAYVETVLSPEKIVEGLSTVYSVVVYSNVPDILRVEVVSDPGFGSLKTRELRLGRGSDTYLGEKKEKGETWYGFVVDNVIVTPEKKGTYTISGGKYNICLGIEGYTEDWFWGPRRTTVPQWVEAKAPDAKLSVSKRPGGLSDSSSVSVGDFKCEWSVPPGDINEGSRALAIYRVSGDGTLDEEAIPDFKSVFGEELKVVYVKPESSVRLSGTTLKSEMEIVVEFIPEKSGRITLPQVAFTYLDPKDGKMRKCLPDKTEIEVKPDAKPASSKARIYEI